MERSRTVRHFAHHECPKNGPLFGRNIAYHPDSSLLSLSLGPQNLLPTRRKLESLWTKSPFKSDLFEAM